MGKQVNMRTLYQENKRQPHTKALLTAFLQQQTEQVNVYLPEPGLITSVTETITSFFYPFIYNYHNF